MQTCQLPLMAPDMIKIFVLAAYGLIYGLASCRASVSELIFYTPR